MQVINYSATTDDLPATTDEHPATTDDSPRQRIARPCDKLGGCDEAYVVSLTSAFGRTLACRFGIFLKSIILHKRMFEPPCRCRQFVSLAIVLDVSQSNAFYVLNSGFDAALVLVVPPNLLKIFSAIDVRWSDDIPTTIHTRSHNYLASGSSQNG